MHEARGYCHGHYRRLRLYGDATRSGYSEPARLPAEGDGIKQQLPDGNWFYFDEADLELVRSRNWHFVSGYVQTEVGSRKSGTRKHLRLHRLIMRPEAHQLVDHINRDPLDNRRENLRLADKSKNGMNRTAQANNTSGYKGVAKHCRDGEWTGKWRAYITVNKKTKHLGLFATPQLAHAAYMDAAQSIHGEFACG